MITIIRTVSMVRTVLVLGLVALTAAACSSGDGSASDAPHVVVTTNILGDVVENLVGEAAVVEVVMPPNADPHDFAASAQQAASMREADALVVNGLGFEEGLVDTIEAAADDGVPVITATDAIDPIPFGDGDDPHLFTDPARMRAAAALIADQLGEAIPALATADGEARVTSYLDSLDALDQEVEDLVATVPAEDRLLVTNHDVFGYFADRYDFEVRRRRHPGRVHPRRAQRGGAGGPGPRDRRAGGPGRVRRDVLADPTGRGPRRRGRGRGGGGALQRVPR